MQFINVSLLQSAQPRLSCLRSRIWTQFTMLTARMYEADESESESEPELDLRRAQMQGLLLNLDTSEDPGLG